MAGAFPEGSVFHGEDPWGGEGLGEGGAGEEELAGLGDLLQEGVLPDLVQFPQDIVHQDGHSASLVLFSEQLEHGEAEGEGGGAAFPFGAIGGQDFTLEEAGQVASLGAVVGHALPAVPGEGLLQALCVLCLDFLPAAWGAFQEPSDAGEVCACHGTAFADEEGECCWNARWRFSPRSPLPWNPLSARMTAVSIPIPCIMLPKALASRTLPGWLL